MRKLFYLGSYKLIASSLKPQAKKLAASSLWLAAILVLTAASCTKEEETKHKNIVTATINGKPWKAGCEESSLFGCTSGDLQYYPNTGGFELAASNIERDSSMAIILREVFDVGDFHIASKSICAIIVKEEPCGRQGHYINEDDPQEIQILSIDKEKKIIEGRFHYIGRDTNCLSEPVHITNGYFKFKYRP